MAVEVALNTPLAEALSNTVQQKVSEVGWSSGGLDDSALGEYIILMLVNGKTEEQIAAELSQDLLNLASDDTGAIDFAKWLFQQVETLSSQLNGLQAPQHPQEHAVSPYEDRGTSIKGASRQSGDATGADSQTIEAMEDVQDGAIPTGPKSMRTTSRPGNKRMIGQLSKAMDRSNDAVLHRVRPQQGTERINMHNRQPPKGPRNDQARNARPVPNGRPVGMSNQHGPKDGVTVPLMQMTPQQQMQLLSMYEEQARMMSQMSQIFSPQQQQMFTPSISQPAINPSFQPQQRPGRSLFERVEGNPQRQNAPYNGQAQQNGSRPGTQTKLNLDSSFGDNKLGNGDVSSSMEVESSQTAPADISPDAICKYNLKCTKKDCAFAHQSPAARPGVTIDVTDVCPFGAACQNFKCVGRHPSPAQKIAHQTEQDCKYFPNCTNAACPFKHPDMPVCKFAASCTREGCKFTHVQTPCRFNPCLNPNCPYKHVEGQRRGTFGDKVWVADQQKEHVSERRFVDNEAAEELVVPNVKMEDHGGSPNSAEVVT